MNETAKASPAARGRLQTLTGTVVGNQAQKSITVRVDRRVAHPVYGKVVRKFKKYIVHDEKDEAREGDTVEIVYTRPLSKRKTFRLARILRRAEG